MLSKRHVALVVLPVIARSALFAGTSAPVIGMASTQNSFALTLDNARVSGNATIFDGANVEANGYVRVQLNNGSSLDFAAGSKGKVFANSVSLESGMSEVQSGNGFVINAGIVKVHPVSAAGVARLKVDPKQVYVTAVNAPAEVVDGNGKVVATVAPGSPMLFKVEMVENKSRATVGPQAGAIALPLLIALVVGGATAVSLGAAAAAGAFNTSP